MFYYTKLKEARLSKKKTTREIGRVIQRSGASISRYETGKRRPDFHTKLKLAWAYGKDINFFYEEPKKLWE